LPLTVLIEVAASPVSRWMAQSAQSTTRAAPFQVSGSFS
jgi:hypothetical protein